jgi:hypothetical protein
MVSTEKLEMFTANCSTEGGDQNSAVLGRFEEFPVSE